MVLVVGSLRWGTRRRTTRGRTQGEGQRESRRRLCHSKDSGV
jgi:hypothetical protein